VSKVRAVQKMGFGACGCGEEWAPPATELRPSVTRIPLCHLLSAPSEYDGIPRKGERLPTRDLSR
jgi:hypothetical protein